MTSIKRLLLFIFIPVTLFANGGSTYTRYGLGDMVLLNSARNLGLGSIGFSVADGNSLSSINPAAWSRVLFTRFELGMYYSGKEISDNSASAMYSEFEFSGFLIGFPIDRELGITLVGGLVPYSQVGYEVESVISHPLIDDDFRMNLLGSGGINKFFIGTSYRTPLDITLGLAFEYYTGKIEYSSLIDFPANSVYKDATYLNKSIYNGVGFNIGIISNDFSKFLGIEKIKDLRLGLNFNPVFNVRSDSTLFAATSLGTEFIDSGLNDISIPTRIGVGGSFVWDDNYLVMFDYITQPMSSFEFRDDKSEFLTDFYRLSLSMEYKNLDVRNATFWEQVALRCGLSYEQSQYRIHGEDIKQMSVHAGLSFPISFESSIDVGLEYGIRGTTDYNLLKEKIYKAFVTINFGELWFIRQER